jgi:hypothetical protein
MYTYPRPQNLPYPGRVLSNEERFLEAILQRTERELAGPGRPGTADRLVAKVERREAQRPTSLGARGALPREVGRLIPPHKGATSLHPGASRRSTPLARFARDQQTSDALRRENARAWLFEILDHALVSRARCGAKCRFAEPGSYRAPRLGTAPALQRTAEEALRCVRGTQHLRYPALTAFLR